MSGLIPRDSVTLGRLLRAYSPPSLAAWSEICSLLDRTPDANVPALVEALQTYLETWPDFFRECPAHWYGDPSQSLRASVARTFPTRHALDLFAYRLRAERWHALPSTLECLAIAEQAGSTAAVFRWASGSENKWLSLVTESENGLVDVLLCEEAEGPIECPFLHLCADGTAVLSIREDCRETHGGETLMVVRDRAAVFSMRLGQGSRPQSDVLGYPLRSPVLVDEEETRVFFSFAARKSVLGVLSLSSFDIKTVLDGPADVLFQMGSALVVGWRNLPILYDFALGSRRKFDPSSDELGHFLPFFMPYDGRWHTQSTLDPPLPKPLVSWFCAFLKHQNRDWQKTAKHQFEMFPSGYAISFEFGRKENEGLVAYVTDALYMVDLVAGTQARFGACSDGAARTPFAFTSRRAELLLFDVGPRVWRPVLR